MSGRGTEGSNSYSFGIATMALGISGEFLAMHAQMRQQDEDAIREIGKIEAGSSSIGSVLAEMCGYLARPDLSLSVAESERAEEVYNGLFNQFGLNTAAVLDVWEVAHAGQDNARV